MPKTKSPKQSRGAGVKQFVTGVLVGGVLTPVVTAGAKGLLGTDELEQKAYERTKDTRQQAIKKVKDTWN